MTQPETVFPFKEGDTFEGVSVQSFLGQGHSASVWRINDAGKEMALKVYFPDLRGDYPDVLVRRVDLELKAGALGHPNLLAVHRKVEGAHNGRPLIGIVMDFVPGQNLGEFIRGHGPLPENLVRQMGIALCDAVRCLHSNGIVHRDIKPGNILLRGGERTPILADLGVVILPGIAEAGTDTGDFVGSWRYASPEHLRDDPPGAGNNHPSDIYSLGVTFFEMITGHRPFGDTVNRARLAEAVLSRYLTIDRTDISPELRRLTLRMVAKSPVDRPKLDEVSDSLRQSGGTMATPTATSDPDAVIKRFSDSPDIARAQRETLDRVEYNRFLNSIHTYFKDLWDLHRVDSQLSRVPGLIGIYTDPPGLNEWPNINEVRAMLSDQPIATFFGVHVQMQGRVVAPCVLYLVQGDKKHLEITRFSGEWLPERRLFTDTTETWSGDAGKVFDWIRGQVAESERQIFTLLDRLNPVI